jgi:hypothetical protein
MIPATQPHHASFRHASPDGKHHYFTHKPVVAWDDDGAPLIVAEDDRFGHRGTLVPAMVYNNFHAVGEGPGDPSVFALIPPAGWRVAWRGDDGTEWTQPLVGWGLRDDGSVVPLDTDCDGLVQELIDTGGSWRVYHPDQVDAHSSSRDGGFGAGDQAAEADQ